MREKAYQTQAEWAMYEVDRWMDRLESRRTLAPDWNVEFWPAVADYLEKVATRIRERSAQVQAEKRQERKVQP